MPQSKQTTLDDVHAIEYIDDLTQKQINIIRLLERGLHQSEIARRLKCDKSTVNRTVRKLEEYGFVIPERIYIKLNNEEIFKKDTGKIKSIAKADPWRGRATQYILTNRLKNLLNQLPQIGYRKPRGEHTLIKIHNLKYKYPILSQSGEIFKSGWKTHSQIKSIYSHSWTPKGPQERHQFHVQTPNGIIGIEYHCKSLVAYHTERNDLLAKDGEEALQILATYIQAGVSEFIHEQHRDGNCTLQLGQPKQITQPHFAFESTAVKKMIERGENTTLPGLFVDDSLKKKGLARGNEYGELETKDINAAGAVDIALRKSFHMEEIVKKTVETTINNSDFTPNAVSDQLNALVSQMGLFSNTLQASAKNIEVLTNGGTAAEFRIGQVVGVLGKVLEDQNLMRTKINELESSQRSKLELEIMEIRKRLEMA